MCMFQHSVKQRRVTMDHQNVMVPGDVHCRDCINAGLEKQLKDHDCLPPDVNCM